MKRTAQLKKPRETFSNGFVGRKHESGEKAFFKKAVGLECCKTPHFIMPIICGKLDIFKNPVWLP